MNPTRPSILILPIALLCLVSLAASPQTPDAVAGKASKGTTQLDTNAAVSEASSVKTGSNDVALIAAAKSIDTGLLLEPPLDLDWFTRDKFVEMVSTVGKHKIGRPWKSPVTKLPPHSSPATKGMTEAEVKRYMHLAKELFDQGKAVPVSDVGLIKKM